MSIQVSWRGHVFTIYTPEGDWNEVSGVYIMCGTNPLSNTWKPLYIGQGDTFKSRFGTDMNRHEVWPEALELGATHVHVMVVPLQADRDRIEQELIRVYNPPLNVHHAQKRGI